MKIGMTGTRKGMTEAQRTSLNTEILLGLHPGELPTEFHHGSCAGADVEAARIVSKILGTGCRIVCHPGPDDDHYRVMSGVDDETLPPKNHFARNRDIVNATDMLVACPCEKPLGPKGGTSYTVEYARKIKKPVCIIWPDGTTDRS